MILNKIFNFFNHPRTALLIILIFLFTFFLTQGLTTGFGNNFLAFGPTKDEKTGEPTTFMGIKLATWKNVGLVYAIIFISTILQVYYNNVVGTNIPTDTTNDVSSNENVINQASIIGAIKQGIKEGIGSITMNVNLDGQKIITGISKNVGFRSDTGGVAMQTSLT